MSRSVLVQAFPGERLSGSTRPHGRRVRSTARARRGGRGPAYPNREEAAARTQWSGSSKGKDHWQGYGTMSRSEQTGRLVHVCILNPLIPSAARAILLVSEAEERTDR